MVYGVGVRPLACWDCRSEFRQGYGCLSYVSVVCCHLQISATRGILPSLVCVGVISKLQQ